MKLGEKILLISGQHIDACETNTSGQGIPYLTGPSDFIRNKPFATKHTESPKVCCEKNDILITVKGSGTGKIAIADKKYCISRQLMAIRCKQIDVGFTQYLLELHENKFNLLATGLIPGISRSDVNNLKIPRILPAEQKEIADLLATWDEAIEKTERLIQAKEQQQTGIIQELINTFCSGWPHIKPSKIFDLISEKNSPGEELLSVTQDRGVIPRSMLEGRVMSPEGTTESYKLVQSGDFVISLRSFQGGIEYSNYRGLISPAYTVLRPKMDLDRDFYRLFFKTTIFIEKYLNLAVIGIRDGKQISIPDFMTIPLPFPEMSDQKKIAGAMLIKRREIDLLKQLAEKYKSQKRGLMQKLLSGQWRVNLKMIHQSTEV